MVKIMYESVQSNSCKISELEEFFWKTCSRTVSNHNIWESDLNILIEWASIDGNFFNMNLKDILISSIVYLQIIRSTKLIYYGARG